MDEYDMPDDEFDRLCEQELELRNELANNGQGKISTQNNFDENDIDFSAFEDNHIATPKENISVHSNISQLGTSNIPDHGNEDKSKNTAISHNFEGLNSSFFNDERDLSHVKKRLLDDISCITDNRTSLPKRRKTSLPVVGYEISQKTGIDPDIEVIERILSHRKMKDMFGDSSSRTFGKKAVSKNKRKPAIHKRIPLGDFQSITTECGKRFYLEVADVKAFDAAVEKVGEVKDRDRLLPMSYRELRDEAEKELLALNSEIMCEETAAPVQRPKEDDEETAVSDLWASKYRPRHYLDLLSDEATNRTVLHWVKLWDKMVFGREAKTRHKDKPAKAKPKFFSKFAPEVMEDLDDMGRPQQKAVLLCGPPGLGKTTLAHIIATHAGYNVVEMNASDDRSVDSFRTNLENATSMKAVFGLDKRPNCLIIDEIDGAPAASINLLVNLLQSKKSKNEGGKKKDKFILHRPVICICNDLYTPSLRPLRFMSLVIQFPPTQSTRLAQRLQFISRKQQLKADLSVLLALCNKTENDIRSCLSVLQFVRISSGELKVTDLEGASVGQKDYQRSFFSVWHDIFTLPRSKRELCQNPHEEAKESGTSSASMPTAKENTSRMTPDAMRFSHILKVAQSCGEYQKLTLGWFENYLQVKFKHIHLEPVTAGLDWATTIDLIQNEIHHNQNWSLGAYVPLSFVAYHFLFASNNWPKLQFPTQFQEVTAKQTKAKGLLDILTSGMTPYTQIFSSRVSLIQDILPYLVHILQPSLRPVNVQLFSRKEKEELSQLVNTMISYNLTYLQEKTPEGTYTFTLDPNIDEIVHFPTVAKPRAMSYSSRQLIAREIELEKVRRSENYFKSQSKTSRTPIPKKDSNLTSSATKSNISKDPKRAPTSNETAKSPLPNHLQKLEAKKVMKTNGVYISGLSSQGDLGRQRDEFVALVTSALVFRQLCPRWLSPTNSKSYCLRAREWDTFRRSQRFLWAHHRDQKR